MNSNLTAIVSDERKLYYSRDYKNDWTPTTSPLWSHHIQRIGLVAMPFLSLHRPFRLPISLGMGSLRVWTELSQLYHCKKDSRTITYHALQTAIATVALAATVFSHPFGMIITTAQDMAFDLKSLINHIKAGRHQEAVKCVVSITSKALYLTLLSRGGLELSIISLAFQALVLVISSIDEFKKDRWLEGCGNLLMSAIRLKQGYSQYEQLKRKWEIDAAIKRIVVGELHKKWQFPSDHLPVGIEVNGVRIISWNVLNNLYMEWVTTKDSQGLNGSLISDLDKQVQDNGLTMRDHYIVDMICSMTSSGQIVALQECGAPFLEALQQRLPQNWHMVKSFDTPQDDQDVVLYDTSNLVYHSDLSEVTHSAYPSVPNRPIQNAVFTRVGQEGSELSIINAHIPGDPILPAREEFADYVYKTHTQSGNRVTVALGDNNFERDEMLIAYQKASFSEFSLHSPWKTNIDPYGIGSKGKHSKAIDHLFVVGDSHSRDLTPDEVLQNYNLQETIALLN